MTLAKATALRLNELLTQKKISQYKLIKLTCLDKTTIQAIFKDKTKDVKLSTIYLIAEALEITIPEFFNSPYFKIANIEM